MGNIEEQRQESLWVEAVVSARIFAEGMAHDAWREERALTYATYEYLYVFNPRAKPGPPPPHCEEVVEEIIRQRNTPRLRVIINQPVWRIGPDPTRYGRMPSPATGFWT
jgi:hypothetical protein